MKPDFSARQKLQNVRLWSLSLLIALAPIGTQSHAQVQSSPPRFDLVCETVRGVRYENGVRQRFRPDHWRFSIDLESNSYRSQVDNVYSTISRVADDRLVLYDRFNITIMVDRYTGEFLFYGNHGPRSPFRFFGTCRVAPFTPLPPRQF